MLGEEGRLVAAQADLGRAAGVVGSGVQGLASGRRGGMAMGWGDGVSAVQVALRPPQAVEGGLVRPPWRHSEMGPFRKTYRPARGVTPKDRP